MPITLSCGYCGKKFEVRPYRKNTAKFCSYECAGKAKIGTSPWNKGKNEIYSQKTLQKMSKNHKGQHSSPKTEFKKGHIPWNNGTKGLYHPTKEARRKISEANKGREGYWKGKTLSEEHKRKIGIACKNHPSWNKGLPPEMQSMYGRRQSAETKQKIRETKLKNKQKGNRGTKKHQKLVTHMANLLDNEENKVEIEKVITITPQHWRIIDVLVDGKQCFEIGQCKKAKIEELEAHGFEVFHLPYSFFE